MLHELEQGDVGVGEIAVLYFAQIGHPVFRDIAVTHHGAQDTCSGGGVAVGILAAAGADVDGLEEITFAIEQTDKDVCAVETPSSLLA